MLLEFVPVSQPTQSQAPPNTHSAAGTHTHTSDIRSGLSERLTPYSITTRTLHSISLNLSTLICLCSNVHSFVIHLVCMCECERGSLHVITVPPHRCVSHVFSSWHHDFGQLPMIHSFGCLCKCDWVVSKPQTDFMFILFSPTLVKAISLNRGMTCSFEATYWGKGKGLKWGCIIQKHCKVLQRVEGEASVNHDAGHDAGQTQENCHREEEEQ